MCVREIEIERKKERERERKELERERERKELEREKEREGERVRETCRETEKGKWMNMSLTGPNFFFFAHVCSVPPTGVSTQFIEINELELSE